MPVIIPIKDLKNTSEISDLCHRTKEPVFVTKNGYGDMVIMSMETYEQLKEKKETAGFVPRKLSSFEAVDVDDELRLYGPETDSFDEDPGKTYQGAMAETASPVLTKKENDSKEEWEAKYGI